MMKAHANRFLLLVFVHAKAALYPLVVANLPMCTVHYRNTRPEHTIMMGTCIHEHILPKNLYNCGIRHVTVPIATRILIANVRHIGLSNICVINLVYFKMQV